MSTNFPKEFPDNKNIFFHICIHERYFYTILKLHFNTIGKHNKVLQREREVTLTLAPSTE